MKKKRFCVLLAAALLTFGTLTIEAQAAEGWALSGSTWIYLDSSGSRMTNVWKKGADNLWRYLNSSGEMATSCWADSDYYVDANGIMVSNQWVKTTLENDSSGDTYYFYFSDSGKCVKDGWKKINNKQYKFGSDGEMLSGWTDDGVYYLGDANDGSMKTGWRYIQAPDDDEDSSDSPDDNEGYYWYYFGSNGKKYSGQDSSDGDYKITKINGNYFCFDEDGKMQTGWVYLEGDEDTAPSDSIEDWRYFAEDGIKNTTLGAAVPGWLSLEPPERLQNNVDESVVWYYFEKDGTPKQGPKFGEASTSDFIRVDGKTYLFNQKGNPASGLYKVEIGETGEYTSYYFDESTKTPLKGKRTVEEGDGTKSTFYFNEGTNAGRGMTGVKDGYLYYMGKRQEADSDSKYALVSLKKSDGTYNTYVVGTSGRISKNTTVKDRDGNKYKVNSSGILTEINGAAVGTGSYGTPVEPVYEDYD